MLHNGRPAPQALADPLHFALMLTVLHLMRTHVLPAGDVKRNFRKRAHRALGDPLHCAMTVTALGLMRTHVLPACDVQ